MHPLISASELSGLLAGPERQNLVVLDATTLLPGERFDPEAEFRAGHIPGARRFDIEAFSDPDGDLPHMVPSQGRFARLITALGVTNGSDVVLYDRNGIVSASRAWWLLGLFGHDRARVLDGGLSAWREAGLPLEQGDATPPEPVQPFVPALRTRRLVGLGDMAELAAHPGATRLLDARSRGRFEGTAPEPRAGLRGGHIPGFVSLPFGDLLQDGRFLRDPATLRARFAEAGVKAADSVVTSCGSGLTASVLALALVAAGYGPGALFDGSWTEWAQATHLPCETGAA